MKKVYEIFSEKLHKRVFKSSQYQKQIDGTYKKLPSAYRFKTKERAIEIAERRHIKNYKIEEVDKVPIEKVIEYCENHIPYFEYFDSVDMDYNDEMVLVGDWWKRDTKKELYTHPIMEFIENNYDNVLTEWHDEWSTCSECYSGIRVSPNSYGWEPSYIITEYGCVCHKCCKENPEYLIEEYKNINNKAIPNWAIELIKNEGFACLEDNEMTCERFQNGWHQGMNDTPEKIIKSIEEEFELKHINDMFDYIFVITDRSQFYINFTIFLRGIEE